MGKKENKYCQKIEFLILVLLVPLLNLFFSWTDFTREDELATPKFSLTQNYDADNNAFWELCNVDGTINNAVLYPSTYITFWISNDTDTNPIDCKIAIELMGYYTGKDVHFDNSSRTFTIADKRKTQLKHFIKNITSAFHKTDGWNINYDISTYFTLSYQDQSEEKIQKILSVTCGDLYNDNDHIYGNDFYQLQEIPKIKTADIEAPVAFKDACTITVNYKHSLLRELLTTKNDYNEYILRCIVDLMVSKESINDPTLGRLLLFDDGTLIIREENKKWFSSEISSPEQ